MIHILAGLNVCIHAMTPITPSSEFASSAMRRIASLSVSTGFQTTVTGRSSCAEIAFDCSATWASVSSP